MSQNFGSYLLFGRKVSEKNFELVVKIYKSFPEYSTNFHSL